MAEFEERGLARVGAEHLPVPVPPVSVRWATGYGRGSSHAVVVFNSNMPVDSDVDAYTTALSFAVPRAQGRVLTSEGPIDPAVALEVIREQMTLPILGSHRVFPIFLFGRRDDFEPMAQIASRLNTGRGNRSVVSITTTNITDAEAAEVRRLLEQEIGDPALIPRVSRLMTGVEPRAGCRHIDPHVIGQQAAHYDPQGPHEELETLVDWRALRAWGDRVTADLDGELGRALNAAAVPGHPRLYYFGWPDARTVTRVDPGHVDRGGMIDVLADAQTYAIAGVPDRGVWVRNPGVDFTKPGMAPTVRALPGPGSEALPVHAGGVIGAGRLAALVQKEEAAERDLGDPDRRARAERTAELFELRTDLGRDAGAWPPRERQLPHGRPGSVPRRGIGPA